MDRQGRQVPTGQDIEPAAAALRLTEFVALTPDGWYAAKPPFDHALVDCDGVAVVVDLSEVAFVLVEAEASTEG